MHIHLAFILPERNAIHADNHHVTYSCFSYNKFSENVYMYDCNVHNIFINEDRGSVFTISIV